MVFIPVVPTESRPPSPQVQDLVNQLTEVLRRSEIQYPGLSTRELLEALGLAARQARPEMGRGRARVAVAVAALVAAAGIGVAAWRSTGGPVPAPVIVAFGVVAFAVMMMVRRLSE